jgi:hypothetical protein
MEKSVLLILYSHYGIMQVRYQQSYFYNLPCPKQDSDSKRTTVLSHFHRETKIKNCWIGEDSCQRRSEGLEPSRDYSQRIFMPATAFPAAFMHQDGDGYNIMLQALPIDGKIVLRLPKTQTEESPPKQPERRPARREK